MAVATSSGLAEACTKMKSLPPVSPTRRGYVRSRSRFADTPFQSPLKVAFEPVKWMPARSRCLRTTSPMSAPLPGTKLMTPSGNPASWKTFIR